MKKAAAAGKNHNASSLLDRLQADLGLRTDRALAEMLGVNPPLISKIRNGKHRVTASFLIRAHEASGHTVQDLRRSMGDNTGYFSSYRNPVVVPTSQIRREKRRKSSLELD
jgi:transcriptional regulator with XRE-family HTH domain